ncbi:MAG: dual specificity protein phosphatase family protein [Haloarculaceae archaeon]
MSAVDEVAPGLYVGDVQSVSAAAHLAAVVSLTHADPPGGYPDGPAVVERPLVDGPSCAFDAFADAVEAVRTVRRRDESVLVHCSAGASRSVSVAAAALAGETGTGLGRTLARISAARAAADPHPALVHHARRYLRVQRRGE